MASYKQEMPPEGGYQAIKYLKRTPPKGLSGYTWFGIISAMTVAGLTRHYFEKQRHKRHDLENNDCRVALEPFMNAERDRMMLRHFREQRDEENRVMGDVEGWLVGGWEGKPIVKNHNNRFPVATVEDYFMHQDPKALQARMHYHQWY